MNELSLIMISSRSSILFKYVSFRTNSTEKAMPLVNTISAAQNVQTVAPQLPPSIRGLCATAAGVKPDALLHGLVNSASSGSHKVTLAAYRTDHDPVEFLPLYNILPDAVHADRKQTLGLAVTLTSNLLQLHGTPWLRTSWGIQDVMVTGPGCGAYTVKSNYLFLCKDVRAVSEGHQVPVADIVEDPSVRNKSLFSLGIALIELWYGKPFADLSTSTISTPSQRRPQSRVDIGAVARVIDRVYGQAGDWYGDAVRRCIYGDFDQRDLDLGRDTVKEAVHAGVLIPLLDHLNALCGGELDPAYLSAKMITAATLPCFVQNT